MDSTPVTFPILVEVQPRGANPHPAEAPPGDVYVARYHQGSTPSEDEIDWPFPVAASEDDERAAAWGPGGRILFLADQGPVGALRAADPGGRAPVTLVALPGLDDYAVLPGGRGFVLSTLEPDGTGLRQVLQTADPDGGNLRRLELGDFRPGDFLALPDGGSLLAANGEGLFRVDLDEERVERMCGGSFREPALSADGRLLVFLRHARGKPTEVRVRHLASGRERRVATQRKGHFLHAPAFSPDGTRVFFSSADALEEGAASAWVVSATGGRPRRLDLFGHFQPARMVPKAA